MSIEVPSALARELREHERVLWCAMPRQGIVLRWSDLIAVPMGLAWAALASLAGYAVLLSGKATRILLIVVVPFVLIGLYLAIGRFLVDRYQRSHTYYAVTDQRIVILRDAPRPVAQSLSLAGLGEITVYERGDESGGIIFAPPHRFSKILPGSTFTHGGESFPSSFALIAQARRVYELIQTAKSNASERPPIR